MKDLLILPFLAFLLHCSAVIALQCDALTGAVALNDVKHCTDLAAQKSKTAQLLLKNVDDQTWTTVNTSWKTITNIEIMVEESSLVRLRHLNLRQITNCKLTVKNNPTLERVEFGTLSSSHLTDLTIADNPKLKSVILASQQGNTFEVKGGKVEITNNAMLEKVEVYEYKSLAGLTVKGNRRLGKDALTRFKDLRMNPPNYVQEGPECVFSKKIADLAELKGCIRVEGDLTLEQNVRGDGSETKLGKITGQVNLGNLPKEKTDFLDRTEVKDSDSIKSDICVELNTRPKPSYANHACGPASGGGSGRGSGGGSGRGAGGGSGGGSGGAGGGSGGGTGRGSSRGSEGDSGSSSKTSEKSSGLGLGVIIGIILGILALIIIVGVTLYFLHFRKKKDDDGTGKKGKKTKKGKPDEQPAIFERGRQRSTKSKKKTKVTEYTEETRRKTKTPSPSTSQSGGDAVIDV